MFLVIFEITVFQSKEKQGKIDHFCVTAWLHKYIIKKNAGTEFNEYIFKRTKIKQNLIHIQQFRTKIDWNSSNFTTIEKLAL